jgi:hypothetical protein
MPCARFRVAENYGLLFIVARRVDAVQDDFPAEGALSLVRFLNAVKLHQLEDNLGAANTKQTERLAETGPGAAYAFGLRYM